MYTTNHEKKEEIWFSVSISTMVMPKRQSGIQDFSTGGGGD